MKKKLFDLGGNRTHDLQIRSTVILLTALRGRTEKLLKFSVPAFVFVVLRGTTFICTYGKVNFDRHNNAALFYIVLSNFSLQNLRGKSQKEAHKNRYSLVHIS